MTKGPYGSGVYRNSAVLFDIFTRPVSGTIKWKRIERLLLEFGAEIREREGSRVAVILFDQVQVFHRPHPSPDTDKAAVATWRKWLEANGITPYGGKK